MTLPPSRSKLVHSRGIYHGLPTVLDSISGLKAIVVGATGMSGQHQIDELARNPHRWSKIYALSRGRPIFSEESNVQHVAVDLSKDAESVARVLREEGVQADYIFFFAFLKLDPAYVRQASSSKNDNAAQLCEVNGRLLQTFLSALDLASITPKRILLQTGLKWYGVHLGPINIPAKESDPRVELEPNFYYTQQDMLLDYCESHPGVSWNNTMPSWILGSVKGSDMSIFFPLAVYASVNKYLGQPLYFPGDGVAWDTQQPISSGVLDSVFHEWLLLDPETKNEAFNIHDDSTFTWSKSWPVLAEWFGMEFRTPGEIEAYEEVEMPLRPRGYGLPGRVCYAFSIVDWAGRPDVQAAWKHLSEVHHLEKNPFVDPSKTFSSLQFSLTFSWSWTASMDKARKFGWHGHVDSTESMNEVFERFVELKMIPLLGQQGGSTL